MTLWPLGLYFLMIVGFVALVLAVSFVLGERHRERSTAEPYESGAPLTGSGRLRFSSGFYVVALLFVIFDLEAVFLFAWAIAAPQAGWTGYFAMAFFVALLGLALLYEWREGALDWAASPQRPPEGTS